MENRPSSCPGLLSNNQKLSSFTWSNDSPVQNFIWKKWPYEKIIEIHQRFNARLIRSESAFWDKSWPFGTHDLFETGSTISICPQKISSKLLKTLEKDLIQVSPSMNWRFNGYLLDHYSKFLKYVSQGCSFNIFSSQFQRVPVH